MKKVFFWVGLTVVALFCPASGVFAADGWASMDGGTTGGAGGTVVDVNDYEDLEYYANTVGTAPYIIRISETINIGGKDDPSGRYIKVRSNKTLIGIGLNPTLVGELDFQNRNRNIIIENLNFTNPPPGLGQDGDGIRLAQDINNVFITKCTIYQCDDGCLDITNNSDYVTVSWCKFYYTSDTGHNFACLVGSSDKQTDDVNDLKVTFHHNWWTTLCKERMPRVRYGQVHVYNNYYSNLMSGGYCIGVGCGARIRVENNYFHSVTKAWDDKYTGESNCHSDGHIGWNTGNIFYNCSQPTWATNEYSTIFTPPYSYTMDDGADVPALVQAYAGAGNPYPPHWLYTVYGDFDINGVVDGNDLETFVDYWLDTTDIDDADYDGDGNVNFYEFALMAENWRKTF